MDECLKSKIKKSKMQDFLFLETKSAIFRCFEAKKTVSNKGKEKKRRREASPSSSYTYKIMINTMIMGMII